ncbi:MAG: TlpA family protein disulfide reductase, partial [Dehalococcoidia bacterium]
IIVLDFWATWCAPCVAELPHLKAVYEKFSKRDDFVLISVSLDDDEEALRAFIAKRKLNWHHVFGESGGAQKAAHRYGVEGLPSLFVIGPDGKIIGRDWYGPELVKKIEQVLEDHDTT